MKVAYVVSERKRKNQYSFEHGEIEFNYTWDDDLAELRKAIRAKHPGKSIVSYSPFEQRAAMIETLNMYNPDIHISTP